MLFRRTPHPIEAEIPRLRRFALALTRDRHTADDLVQDCLARALAAWGTRQQEHSLRPWLFTILHNLWRSRLRREAIRPDSRPWDEAGDGPVESGGQMERLQLRDLDTALGLLSEDHRSLLLLVAVEGLSYEEAAKVQGVPIGTVMSRLLRARERLRHLTDDTVDGDRPQLRRVK